MGAVPEDTTSGDVVSATMDDKLEGDANRDSSQSRGQALEAEQYPTGFRMVLLAGASIMGVFLISLDQVSGSDRILTMVASR